MAQRFFPVLSHFQNNNGWLSSDGRLRYNITPTLFDEEGTDGTLAVEVWEGPWAYEFAQVEEVKEFPLSNEGLQDILQWLEEWHQVMEARPPHTLEENIARKKKPETAE